MACRQGCDTGWLDCLVNRSDLIQAVEWVVSYVVAMPEFDKDKARPEVTSPEFVRAGRCAHDIAYVPTA